MLLRITTFGHRNGPLVAPEPDLLFDIRPLPNPPKDLRTEARRTGQLIHMQEWLFALPSVKQLFNDIRIQIYQRLRKAEDDGLNFVHVGLGCNLGRNRSVTIAEALATLDWNGWQVEVQHRDRCLPHVGKDSPLTAISPSRAGSFVFNKRS
jgi:RNase adaptor protein for sRNA GlmZ degradation